MHTWRIKIPLSRKCRRKKKGKASAPRSPNLEAPDALPQHSASPRSISPPLGPYRTLVEHGKRTLHETSDPVRREKSICRRKGRFRTKTFGSPPSLTLAASGQISCPPIRSRRLSAPMTVDLCGPSPAVQPRANLALSELAGHDRVLGGPSKCDKVGTEHSLAGAKFDGGGEGLFCVVTTCLQLTRVNLNV